MNCPACDFDRCKVIAETHTHHRYECEWCGKQFVRPKESP